MEPLLKVGDRAVYPHEITTLLSRYELVPALVKELVVDSVIANVALTPEEMAEAEAKFCKKNQITAAKDRDAWLKQRYGTADLIESLALRYARLEKFKFELFNNDIESYFLQRKSQLDRVLYSLIRTRDAGLAQELYFRIHDDGQDFGPLAQEFSEGQEAKTGGLIGPVELSVPHPALAHLLSISQPDQIWPPRRIGEWVILVKLEKFFPAQLDDAMRQRLIDELFQGWLQEKVQGTPVMMATSPFDSLKTVSTATIAVDADVADPTIDVPDPDSPASPGT